jgi:hypothetical protein
VVIYKQVNILLTIAVYYRLNILEVLLSVRHLNIILSLVQIVDGLRLGIRYGVINKWF